MHFGNNLRRAGGPGAHPLRTLVFLVALTFLSCSEAQSSGIELPDPPPAPIVTDQPTAYYLDAATGDDKAAGTSPATAWRSLKRANQLKLKAGDSLLLRRGQEFTGELSVSGQGTQRQPIYIGAYGQGAQPIVRGYRDSKQAMTVYNSKHLTVHNLDIVNTGKERMAGRTGIRVEAEDFGEMPGITLRHLTISDVNGSLVKQEGGGSAIFIINHGDKTKSWFDGLTIDSCHIVRCERNAIIWSGYYDRRNWCPSTGTVVTNNLIEQVPGDGIVPIGCVGTMITDNVMRDCPDILPDTEAAAGIWPWSCDNTVVMHNDVSGHKAPWDGQAYDCDYNCQNTVFLYNYSHDNYGGMMLICDSGQEREYSLGNKSPRVGYNISIGDGQRPKATPRGIFSPSLHLCGRVTDAQVDHNIIHAAPRQWADADRTMVCSDSWDGYTDGTRFESNIFFAAEASPFNLTKSTNNTWTGNWYLGPLTDQPHDPTAKEQQRYGSTVYEQLVGSGASDGKALLQLMDERELYGVKWYRVNEARVKQFFQQMEEGD